MQKGLAAHIVNWEWLVLLVLLPAVLLASPATSPALLLIPLLWLLRKRVTGRFFIATPLDVSFLLLLFMVLVSLYATFDIAYSFAKVAGLVYGIALYYAVVAAASRSRRHLWLGVGFYLASGYGVVALGVLGTQWSSKLPVLRNVVALLPGRVLGTPGQGIPFNPNEVAGVLLWITPLALALTASALLRYRSLRASLGNRRALLALSFLLLTSLVLTSTLLLTQSRSGLLGFAISLLFLLLAGAGRYRRSLLALTALLLIGASAFLVLADGNVASVLLFEQAGLEITADGSLNTLEGRQEIWSRALYGIQDFPFTGMGMNTFRRVVHILYPLFLIPPGQDIVHAHNNLLHVALGLGLPGLIAYLALWLGVVAILWHNWRTSPSTWARALAAGLAAALLAYFVYGLTDTVMLGARPGFIFWALFALAIASYRMQRAPDLVSPEAG